MFEIEKTAEIKAINIAKGNNDESPLCVTIGLEFEGIQAGPAAAVLGCQESDLDAWFTDKGELRFNGVDDILTWAEFKDQHKVKMLGFLHEVAKVSKIKVRPYGGRLFKLRLNIQLQDPPDHVIEKVASSLHSMVPITLTQEPELPLNHSEAA